MRPQNIVLAILALVFLLSIKPLEANRVLYKEQMKTKNILLQSLDHSAITPSGPSGSTNLPTPSPPHIPASSTTINTISEKDFVGHTMPPPPVNPRLTIPFGVAKN
ncbi:hypothetical protein LOK49_LG15G00610 [Camellia lanceoleosa]|uniref:Uncharacterized protein n=1 Tax=Camellia lanceoleosa TaxID=1840588 RepID=A0ACC0F608_9ERIC|nr:hypothetical protein LOK49_LG15G00610 [Camellia lanceoleosa]